MSTARVSTLPVNPFSTRFVRPDQTLYRFAGDDDAEAVANRLTELLLRRGVAAIVGPHGTGKSTLVHTLLPMVRSVFSDVHRIQFSSASDNAAVLRQWQLHQQQWRAKQPHSADSQSTLCLVLDGFEQLHWLERQRLIWQTTRWPRASRRVSRICSRSPYLLLTSHRPQLGVTTFHETQWDESIVQQLTCEKLRVLPLPERLLMLRIAEREAEAMKAGSMSDRSVRDYWFTLYDEYERLRRGVAAMRGIENHPMMSGSVVMATDRG
jgi:hypothetical protein